VVVGLLMLAGLGTLAGRLAYLQVIEQARFAELARSEQLGKRPVVPRRGSILAADGHPLAISLESYDVYFYPRYPGAAESRDRIAAELAPLLKRPTDEVRARLAADVPTLVAAGVQPDVASRIAAAELPGIVLNQKWYRYYPEGALAGPVLGFIGKDAQGLSGVEADYDVLLAGKTGWVYYERDAAGEEIPLGLKQVEPPVDGADLVLTLDRYIQRVAETELDRALKEHRADSGVVIVMDPKTGALLAVVSRPAADPTKLDLNDPKLPDLTRNRAFSDLYEPGSTFKIITLAAALESGRVGTGETYYCPGYVKVGPWTIWMWNYTAMGPSNLVDFIRYSCNVGAVHLSRRTGPEDFYRVVRDFGFTERLNPEFRSEVAGHVKLPADPTWSEVDLATNAFGQALSVTPLELATAVAAVANGGVLMRPYLVKEVRGPDGVRRFEPTPIRRVVSEDTARKVTSLLVEAVNKGSSPTAIVPGYKLAGKTGTAQVPEGSGYSKTKYVASYIGYLPADDPRLLILVKIDNPKDVPWGTTVAAPVFREVASKALAYYGIPPSGNPR